MDVKAIINLSLSEITEERIASMVLSLRVHDETKSASLLFEVANNLQSQFMLSVLNTKSIQVIAHAFFHRIMRTYYKRKFINIFSSHIKELGAQLFHCSIDRSINLANLENLVLLIAVEMNSSNILTFFESLIIPSKSTDHSNGTNILRLFCLINTAYDMKQRTSNGLHIDLSAFASDALRSLIIQCLHGGAQEAIRDSCLSTLSILLDKHRNIVRPSWTVEPSVQDEIPNLTGQFASLVCFVIRGELHLLVDEALSLFGGGDSEAGILETGGSGDSEHGSEHVHDGNIDASKHGIDDAAVISKRKAVVRRIRCDRIATMSSIIFSLQESVLHLLVGWRDTQDDSEVVEGDQEEVSCGDIWGTQLPGNIILKIRESMHGCAQEYFDCLKCTVEAGRAATQADGAASGGISSSFMHPQLQQMLLRGANVLNKWLCEDAALHGPFVDNLSLVLQCSSLCRAGGLPDVESEGCVWEMLMADKDSSTSRSSQVQQRAREVPLFGDVFIAFLPGLLQVMQEINEGVGGDHGVGGSMTARTETASQAEPAVSEAAALRDRMGTVTSLGTTLVDLIQIIAKNFAIAPSILMSTRPSRRSNSSYRSNGRAADHREKEWLTFLCSFLSQQSGEPIRRSHGRDDSNGEQEVLQNAEAVAGDDSCSEEDAPVSVGRTGEIRSSSGGHEMSEIESRLQRYSSLCATLTMSCEALQTLIQWRLHDLVLLAAGDGAVDAFGAIVGIPGAALQGLLVSLGTLLGSDHSTAMPLVDKAAVNASAGQPSDGRFTIGGEAGGLLPSLIMKAVCVLMAATETGESGLASTHGRREGEEGVEEGRDNGSVRISRPSRGASGTNRVMRIIASLEAAQDAAQNLQDSIMIVFAPRRV